MRMFQSYAEITFKDTQYKINQQITCDLGFS